MDAMEVLMQRRSIRAFTADKPSRADITAVVKAGCYAPSAMNSQSRQFIVVESTDILASLNELVEKESDEETVKRIKGRSADGEFNFFYHAPVLILACNTPDERYPAEDCACALTNMFNAAKALGLGSCWINQLKGMGASGNSAEVLGKLGLKKGYEVYGCCALGYPENDFVEPTKPKTNEILFV